MKLYLVTLRGMKSSPSGPSYGESYVLAEDPTTAYGTVRTFLDSNDIGFSSEREMESIELIAGTDRYNDTKHIIFIQGGEK